MREQSSLSQDQRAAAIALFEVGWAEKAVAGHLGASVSAVDRLYDRWRVRGRGAVVVKPTKRSFSFEFKLDVVRRFLAGETKVSLAQEFDLSSPKLVETWARLYRNGGEDALRPKPQGRPQRDPNAAPRQESEVERLRRENERLRAEVAYLGKFAGLESTRTALKVQAVIALKAEHRLELLIEVAGLARSTFFYHQARLATPDPQADLKAAIIEVFTAARGRYGHRRVHLELVRTGWRLARKTVLKLMRQLGLRCQVRRRRRYSSYRGEVGKAAANLLERDFAADAPNQKWVTDVTEFWVAGQKIYLSPMMDLFDRQILSFSWSPSPNLALTNSTLDKALARLPDEAAPIVHSDQGFQYRHPSWQARLAEAGARQSMSRKGNCLDNAVIENFFGHLKAEMFHHVTYRDVQSFTDALEDYIDWWNTTRTSTTLKGLSPVQYRAQALSA